MAFNHIFADKGCVTRGNGFGNTSLELDRGHIFYVYNTYGKTILPHVFYPATTAFAGWVLVDDNFIRFGRLRFKEQGRATPYDGNRSHSQ